MGLERIRKVSAVIPVTPRRIYDAWLSSDEHSSFTGAPAQISARKGSRFTAHDGYISGSNLDLERGTRIVQSWRTTDFPEDAEDSQLEITFIQSETGTRVVINHGGIPEGQGERYHTGWSERYLKPLSRYFLSRRDTPEALVRAARRAESSDDQDAGGSSLGTLISARQPRATPAKAPVASSPADSEESPQGGTRRRAPATEATAPQAAPTPRALRKRSPPSEARPKAAAKVARPDATKTRKAPVSSPAASKTRTRKPVRRKGVK